ncbi:3'-5' exonuclease [Nocardioides halotolerans]|uniref:3'-5' exonuclease n=1 Tax=Nocardioides halotolerans TaxID=433660 RepID=UPI000684A6CD|nr:3'-5' exonuclease [Nocardioides halotolerans]
MHGVLFTYGGDRASHGPHQFSGPYAVIDFQTTGLAPRGADRVIEVALVRVEADGTVGEAWSTLVNPGRNTGVPFIHKINDADVSEAPTFAQIAPYLLSQLDGAVVVAHNAPFDEEFLAAELRRAGYADLRMPGLCTLWLTERTMGDLPNRKLPTLARELNIPLTTYVSRDHVIATAVVLNHALAIYGKPLLYGSDVFHWNGGPVLPPRVVNKVRGLRKGSGWMSSLLTKLPVIAGDVPDAASEAYYELLCAAMEDGQITRDEAQALGSLAGEGGMSRRDVEGLNKRFLETMREAAFTDDELTAAELRELTRAAKALGVPDYFDDLTPTDKMTSSPPSPVEASAGSGAEASTRAATADASPVARRCGNCGEAGHYRPTCPSLTAVDDRSGG